MRFPLVLLALAVCACGAPDTFPVAVQSPGMAPKTVMLSILMDYDPVDVPLAWTKDGRVVIAHAEQFSAHDVYDSSCAGSGFYEISLATRKVRKLGTGGQFCEAALALDGMALHPALRTVVYSQYAEVNRSRLARVNFRTRQADTIVSGCRIYAEHPSISPDGEWVAARGLCRDRNEEEYSVFVVRLDGSARRSVPLAAKGSYGSPAWSPDGRRLAVVRSYGGITRDSSEVWRTDVAGGGQRFLARGIAPAWHPSGDSVAFVVDDPRSGEGGTWIVAQDGTGARRIFRNRERTTYARGWGPWPEGSASGPLVWSPDGRELLFSRRYDAGTSVWRLIVATGAASPMTRPDQ